MCPVRVLSDDSPGSHRHRRRDHRTNRVPQNLTCSTVYSVNFNDSIGCRESVNTFYILLKKTAPFHMVFILQCHFPMLESHIYRPCVHRVQSGTEKSVKGHVAAHSNSVTVVPVASIWWITHSLCMEAKAANLSWMKTWNLWIWSWED